MADPNRWVKIRTPSQSRIYYHNPHTDITAWDLPEGAEVANEPVINNIEQGVKRGYKRSSLEVPEDLTTRSARSNKTNKKRMANTLSKKNTTASSNRNTHHNNKNNNNATRQQRQTLLLKPGDRLSDISDSSDSTRTTGSTKEIPVQEQKLNCVQRFKTMPCSVWMFWILPTVCILATALYFDHAQTTNMVGFRPATPNQTQVIYKALGTDAESEQAYINYGLKLSPLAYKRDYDTCRANLVQQTSEKLVKVCEGYCKVCELGGDTETYPETPWGIAIIWTIGFFATLVLFPIVKQFFCNKGTGTSNALMWADFRAFVLLVLVVVLFCAMLFLIHQSRVIAVPQAHSMFTFWVFYSSYFFWSSLVYWMRMDLQLIKARNPELALFGAFCGWCICTNAVGAYYLTGIQMWPCFLSSATIHILYPAYFLSFTRRGLELWVVVSHHKKVLQKMKAEEFNALDDDDDDDDDDDGRITVSSNNSYHHRMHSRNRPNSVHRNSTYDADNIDLKTKKRMKLRKKIKKKTKNNKRKDKGPSVNESNPKKPRNVVDVLAMQIKMKSRKMLNWVITI